MMTNEEFKKQLIRRAFQLARRIIALVDKFPNKRSAWVISDQLLRATTSIGANIIEAQAASSSGNETKFWLALSRDLDEKLNGEINECIKETDELVKILGSSIATMKGKRKL